MRDGGESEVVRALAGGLGATAAMTGACLVSKELGLFRLDFGRMLGTLFARDSQETRVAGWALSLANGTVFALGYQQAFRRLGLCPNALTGALLGAAHAAASFGILALARKMHPRPRQAGLREMGPFAYGPLTVPGLMLGHLLYGAVVGWAVGQAPRRASYVSNAYLRWLKRQEETDHVEQHPIPITPRLRSAPAAQPEPAEPPALVQRKAA